MKQVAATPVAFVRAMVLAYEKYGKDPEAALRQAQITPELLCLPNGRITASQMETISGLAMQELDDEALGSFSRRLPWGSYGMLVPGLADLPDARRRVETLVSSSPAPDRRPRSQIDRDRRGRRTGHRRDARSRSYERILPHHQ